MEMRHSIKAVAQQTGLSPHVIRIWEKRYAAVEPQRTDTNRRYYSQEDVRRLNLLRQATEAGHAIRHVAGLSLPQLQALIPAVPQSKGERVKVGEQASAKAWIEKAEWAISQLDEKALAQLLDEASVAWGLTGTVRFLVSPLLQRVGQLWEEGELRVLHERFASNVLRHYLLNVAGGYSGADGPPLVVTTPRGQLHELGAVMVATLAASKGWKVIYLGPSLPASEIAGAVKQYGASWLALSLVYPEDDAQLPDELLRLRTLLPDSVRILAGGRATTAYAAALQKADIRAAQDLDEWVQLLDSARGEGKPGSGAVDQKKV